MKNQLKQPIAYLVCILALFLFSQSCNMKQEGSLSIEAALVFKSGDVKPVARTEFFLLNKDFDAILQESNFASELPPNLKEPTSKISRIQAFSMFVRTTKEAERTQDDSAERTKGLDAVELAVAKALTATRPHIVYTTTTDFQGKAQFTEVKAGEYYLFGYTKVGKTVVVWNLKTVVKSSQNSVTLDQNNASSD
jgi:hypothetical protein